MQKQDAEYFGRPIPLEVFFQAIRDNIVSVILLFCTFIFLSVVAYYLSPKIFRSEVAVFPNDELKAIDSNGAVSGSFSALDFLGANQSRDLVSEHLAILKSRNFLRLFLKKKGLIDKLSNYRSLRETTPTELKAVSRFKKKVLDVKVDRLSGQITLSIDWHDPEQSASLAADLISELNGRLRNNFLKNTEARLAYLGEKFRAETVSERRSILLSLIEKEEQKRLLANAQTEFAMRVVDPSYVPDGPVSPKLLLYLAVGAVLGGVFSAVYAILRYNSTGRREFN